MKRIAFALLALSLGGALAFGQDAPAVAAPVVTISDWGRQIFAVGNQDSSGYWAGLGTSWGASPRIVGLNIQAHNDTSGFSITPSADNGTFGLTDQNKAWITPMPGLTFESGINLETDTWRGTGDFGTYDWIRFPGEHGDSVTFFRLGEPGAPTLETDLNYNKDGIGAWALVQQNGGGAIPDFGSNIQAGAAYTIPSIGQIKAQFIGYNVNGTGALMGNNAYGSTKVIENSQSSTSTTYALNTATGNVVSTTTQTVSTGSANTFGIIQAAFNLKTVENLYEEVGVIVPTSASNAGYVFNLSDVVGYKMDKINLHGLIVLTSFNGTNGTFNNVSYTSSGLGLEGHVGADYDLGDSLTVGGDVLYVNQLELNSGVSLPSSTTYTNNTASVAGNNYYNAGETGVGLSLAKGFSNGSLGVGFEYTTLGWNGGNTTGTTAGASHWAIPIKAEEWF